MQQLNISHLHKCFAEIVPTCDIHFFDEVASTNTISAELLKNHTKYPFTCVATRQTKGRGRLDRKWFSDDKSSLCMTVVAKLPDDSNLIQSITVRSAINICKSLKNHFGSETLIKWPNDIYSKQGKKIAGILSELRILNGSQKFVIMGIGINVYQLKNIENIDPSIVDIMDNLSNVSSKEISINNLCAIVSKAIIDTCDSMNISNLPKDFSNFDWLNGKQINLDIGEHIITGTACGIDNIGQIAIAEKLGDTPKFYSALEATLHTKK